MDVSVAGRQMTGFPALVDRGENVDLRVFDTPDQARLLHRAGLRRLFALALREPVKTIEKGLPGGRDLALQFINIGSEKDLREQLVAAALERTCLAEPLPVNANEFVVRKEAARTKIILVAQEIARLLQAILGEYASLQRKIASVQKAFPQACADIAAQAGQLLEKNFIVATPFERLAHYPRYLKAANLRLDKARVDAPRDARLMGEWQSLGKPFEREWAIQVRSGVADPALEEFRWLLEELRVALFAQELRTPSPVSVKRLQKMWEARVRR
jgi:ATP-dependent helicase HrpA